MYDLKRSGTLMGHTLIEWKDSISHGVGLGVFYVAFRPISVPAVVTFSLPHLNHAGNRCNIKLTVYTFRVEFRYY